MPGAGRDIARTGVLTVLLLLILPAGASAAGPSGLLGQTVASVNDVVQSTGATVDQVTTQVDGVVARTVEGTQPVLRGEIPATPVDSVPVPDTGPGGAVHRTVTTTESVVPGATGPDPSTAAEPAPPHPAHRGGQARHDGSAAAAPDDAARAVRDAAPSPGARTSSSAEGALGSAPATEPATSDEPAPLSTLGHALGAASGGVASAAFFAGAAVLLMALCLAASALMTRLPRFDEVGRPLPLVFALERPG
jgi:hypothetical protein